MNGTIALIGALDTKGSEYAFVRDLIRERGHDVLVIDFGTGAPPVLKPDVTRDELARAARQAGADLATLDRGAAVATMSAGIAALLPRLHADGRFDAVLALGGTGGTSIACAGMRELPLDVPKVMVSTAAGADVSGYVGESNIAMIPSVVDVAGINSVSRIAFARAAGAVCGMLETDVPIGEDRPLIAASMFGNTTDAVSTAQATFERAGYEVLVFHCTGQGGRVMESLIEKGLIAGVFDITTTELADDLVGGVFTAGPDRLEAAAHRGTPAIVVPGCLDMVNFWAPETVPDRFEGRTFYRHNPNVTLMRTTPEENAELGRRLAEKVNGSTGPVTVLVPLKGVSMIDGPDGAFYDPNASKALFDSIEQNLKPSVRLVKMDAFINDPEFAEACAKELLENIAKAASGSTTND